MYFVTITSYIPDICIENLNLSIVKYFFNIILLDVCKLINAFIFAHQNFFS